MLRWPFLLVLTILVLDYLAETVDEQLMYNDRSFTVPDWIADWLELQKQLEGYRTIEHSIKVTIDEQGQTISSRRLTCPIKSSLVTLDDLLDTCAKWSPKWVDVVTNWWNKTQTSDDSDWIFGYDMDKGVAKLYFEQPNEIVACEYDSAGNCSWKHYQTSDNKVAQHTATKVLDDFQYSFANKYDYHLLQTTDGVPIASHFRLQYTCPIPNHLADYVMSKSMCSAKVHWISTREEGYTIYYRHHSWFNSYLRIKSWVQSFI